MLPKFNENLPADDNSMAQVYQHGYPRSLREIIYLLQKQGSFMDVLSVQDSQYKVTTQVTRGDRHWQYAIIVTSQNGILGHESTLPEERSYRIATTADEKTWHEFLESVAKRHIIKCGAVLECFSSKESHSSPIKKSLVITALLSLTVAAALGAYFYLQPQVMPTVQASRATTVKPPLSETQPPVIPVTSVRSDPATDSQPNPVASQQIDTVSPDPAAVSATPAPTAAAPVATEAKPSADPAPLSAVSPPTPSEPPSATAPSSPPAQPALPESKTESIAVSARKPQASESTPATAAEPTDPLRRMPEISTTIAPAPSSATLEKPQPVDSAIGSASPQATPAATAPAEPGDTTRLMKEIAELIDPATALTASEKPQASAPSAPRSSTTAQETTENVLSSERIKCFLSETCRE